MAWEPPEKEKEWIEHHELIYGKLTEREKVIYHLAFEDGERNQIRRITAEKIRAVHKGQGGFSQGDPIQRSDRTGFQQGDPIEKVG